MERLKTPKKRKSKTNFKVLPSKKKKHPYSERVGRKAEMMKKYYKAKISLSQMMQISNDKYKALLVDNKEDDVTEIIIKYYVKHYVKHYVKKHIVLLPHFE